MADLPKDNHERTEHRLNAVVYYLLVTTSHRAIPCGAALLIISDMLALVDSVRIPVLYCEGGYLMNREFSDRAEKAMKSMERLVEDE